MNDARPIKYTHDFKHVPYYFLIMSDASFISLAFPVQIF